MQRLSLLFQFYTLKASGLWIYRGEGKLLLGWIRCKDSMVVTALIVWVSQVLGADAQISQSLARLLGEATLRSDLEQVSSGQMRESAISYMPQNLNSLFLISSIVGDIWQLHHQVLAQRKVCDPLSLTCNRIGHDKSWSGPQSDKSLRLLAAISGSPSQG